MPAPRPEEEEPYYKASLEDCRRLLPLLLLPLDWEAEESLLGPTECRRVPEP